MKTNYATNPNRPLAIAFLALLWLCNLTQAQEGNRNGQEYRSGSIQHREAIIRSLPLDRLTPEARSRILSVVQKPTLFRELPNQVVQCDRSMFLFLARNPDVLVGLWDLMGITKVQANRIGPYEIEATDGVGTDCSVDLIYGDAHQHVYWVEGTYKGMMVPGTVRGNGVFILRSQYGMGNNGQTTVSGTMDCFVQFESLGIDLLTRTLSPIIGRSADSNFTQTAQFMAQVSQASQQNPAAMLDIAERLPQVDPPVKRTFGETIVTVAKRHWARPQVARGSSNAGQADAGQADVGQADVLSELAIKPESRRK